MKVDLSDKQCAKKHKKFFISLHFSFTIVFQSISGSKREVKGPHQQEA